MRLGLEKYPKTDFEETLRIKVDTIEKIWNSMAKKKLLSSKHLKDNILYSPKLKERADEYTKKLQSKSRHNRDKLRVQDNTLQYITRQYITLKGWSEKSLTSNDYSFIHSEIEKLLFRAKGNVNKAIQAIEWVSQQDYEWTIGTVNKKWPDFAKRQKSLQIEERQNQQLQEKLKQMQKEAKEHPINSKELKKLTEKIGKK